MSEALNFIRNQDCWGGILPNELRDVNEWKEEINTGSNAPGLE